MQRRILGAHQPQSESESKKRENPEASIILTTGKARHYIIIL